MGFLNRLKKNTEGASTLEMVIVLPFLLAIMFGIMDVSYIFFVKHEIEQASREGARVCALFGNKNRTLSNVDLKLDTLPGDGSYPTFKVGTSNGVVTCSTLANGQVQVTVSAPVEASTLVGYLGPLSGLPDLTATSSIIPEWN